MIAGNSIIVATPDQLSTNVGEEIVILNIASGVYHGLDGVGARVWQLIQEEKTFNEIRETILAEYEVEAEQCDNDLRSLLQELSEAGIIKAKNETGAQISAS